MLKLTYTDTGLNIERLAQSPEQLVALRVMLAMRVGETIIVEPSSASFLLPVDLLGLSVLIESVQQFPPEIVSLSPADANYYEITLQGTWIEIEQEEESDDANGIFVTRLTERIELLLWQLWKQIEITTFVIDF